MKIKLKLEGDDATIFGKMAAEARLDPAGLALVAIYNLIAIWTQDHGQVVATVGGVEIKAPLPVEAEPAPLDGSD